MANSVSASIRQVFENIIGNRPLGCIPSGYDPLVYSLTGAAATVFPEKYHIPFACTAYDQLWYSNCVAQGIRRLFKYFFGIDFGVNMVYGGARTRNHKGLDMLTALTFAVKNGIAPLADDPGQKEVPDVSNYYQKNKEKLHAAAKPYAGKLKFAAVHTEAELKTALMNGGYILFRMEVIKNGLSKFFWWLSGGPNGLGHHCVTAEGWGSYAVSTRSMQNGYDGMNSWGPKWGDNGGFHMTKDGVFYEGEVYAVFKIADADPTRRSLCTGMHGDDVLEAQKLLQKHGYLQGVEIKGNFGGLTFKAVMDFQKNRGIANPDGIIGPQTWSKLLEDPWPIEPQPEPETDRDKLLAKVFEAGAMLIGTDYSQEHRDKVYPGGSFDCSKFVQGIFGAAGILLINGTNELTFAAEQVDAAGFDKVFLNKGKRAPQGYVASAGRPGDIVFFNLKTSTRKYGITHVAVVDKDGQHYIQNATNTRKCERIPLDFKDYDKNVVAVIRLRVDYERTVLPSMVRKSTLTPYVRVLQFALNLRHGERLLCDGEYGALTAKAVAEVNAENGIQGDTCVKATWTALGL